MFAELLKGMVILVLSWGTPKSNGRGGRGGKERGRNALHTSRHILQNLSSLELTPDFL